MPDFDFVSELKIDKFGLDEDALYHAEKAGRWIRLAADALAARDKAKEALEYIEATLDVDIRKNWDIYNPGIKMTENGVTFTLRRSKAFIDANGDFLNAQRDYNILRGAVDAFQQRKDMIEILTKLYLGGYYSRPTIPTESRFAAIARAESNMENTLTENTRIQAAARKRVPQSRLDGSDSATSKEGSE